MTEQTGRCLCGAVRFALSGPFNWQGHCHCESCRRATASPMTSFLGVPNAQWRWTGAQPQMYESSPGVRRWFCGRCGSPMAYDADQFPGETHFFAATLDQPENYAPTFHVFAGEQLGWMKLADELPRFEGMVGTARLDRATPKDRLIARTSRHPGWGR
ncbi:MAG: GFA family protein [Pseudomonadota bacterium]